MKQPQSLRFVRYTVRPGHCRDGFLGNSPDPKNHLLDEGVAFPLGKRGHVRVDHVHINKMFEERVCPLPVFFEKDVVARPRVMPLEAADRTRVAPSPLFWFLRPVEFVDRILVDHPCPWWDRCVVYLCRCAGRFVAAYPLVRRVNDRLFGGR